jgi:hypothetical protein
MLLQLGAKAESESRDGFRLNSIAGELMCHPYENWLACRFTDVEKAKQVIGSGSLNPFSGKWNWHFHKPGPADLVDLHAKLSEVIELASERKEILEHFNEGAKAMRGAASDVRIRFQYRDGSNYKVSRDICFQGGADRWGALSLVRPMLMAMDVSEGSPSFIPGLVGLDDLQDSFSGCESRWDPEDDGPWHELLSVELIPEGSGEIYAEDCSFAQFVQRVQHQAVIQGWDEGYKPPFYAEMAKRQRAYERQMHQGG